MTSTNKSSPGSIPTPSSKRRLRLKKQLSEPIAQSKTLYSNSLGHLDFKQDKCRSENNLMSLTSSLNHLSLKSGAKCGSAISQSTSYSDLSEEVSSKMVRPRMLKKRLRSLIIKKELTNLSPSFPTYDREKYNADGSLHTMHCLPSTEELWGQAEMARYLRNPRQNKDEKEGLLSKQLYPILKYQPMEEARHKTKF